MSSKTLFSNSVLCVSFALGLFFPFVQVGVILVLTKFFYFRGEEVKHIQNYFSASYTVY